MDEFLGGAKPARSPHSASPDTLDRIQKVLVESTRVSEGNPHLPYAQKLDEAASLDSIAVLEFLMAVEAEFGIAIEPEFLEFAFLRDLPALASYVEDRMKRRTDSET